MTQESLIHLDAIKKVFLTDEVETHALAEVHFDIAKGEYVSITGPSGEIALPGQTVDWEVELVAVVGRYAREVSVPEGWDHIAGLTVGQDLSHRPDPGW